MKKFGRSIMWMALLAIVLLTFLSILGAFYGAQEAKSFFNSIPLRGYWYGLAILLAAGFAVFGRLLRKPGLFMVHAGCLLVLAGGMWGSQAGHQLAERLLGTRKIPRGYIVIYEGQAEKNVLAEDFKHQLGELPFSIKLKDFRLEYYEADEKSVPQLHIETQEGRCLQLIARAGEQISLGEGKGRIKIINTFRNFKIRLDDGKKIVTDGEGPAENPAVEVEIERPDGTNYSRYVFERFAGYIHSANDGLQLSYISEKPQQVRDYLSDVVVIENGKEVTSKTIEVNHPLYYGGYHFYQDSYDAKAGKYTVLSVTSDSGLYAVYGGYWLLCLGVLWQFWFRHIVSRLKKKKQP